MQNVSPNLTFDLMKTLESSEKAYIKKNFSPNEKNLKLLFDDFNKTEVYNKVEFKRKYKNRAYIINFAQNKNYLRKKIVDELIQYYTKSISNVNQRYKLNVISILIHKGFYVPAVKLIEKALKYNEQQEHYIKCYELCSLVSNLTVNRVNYDLPKKIIDNYRKKRRFYVKQLARIEQFAELADVHFLSITDKQKLRTLQNKFSELEIDKIDDLPNDYPFYAKRIFNYSKGKLAELLKDTKSTVAYLKKGVILYDKYPHFLKRNKNFYLTDSLNYLDRLVHNKIFDQFFTDQKKIVKRIEEILNDKVKSSFISSFYVIKYLFFQIACTNSQQHQKAYTFSKKYETFIKNERQLSNQFLAASHIVIAVARLNVQQYEEALDLIVVVQKTPSYEYQYELRLIQVICHYCLNNDLVLDSLFSSFLYYLKKQEQPKQRDAILQFKKSLEQKDVSSLKHIQWDELLSLNVEYAISTIMGK